MHLYRKGDRQMCDILRALVLWQCIYAYIVIFLTCGDQNVCVSGLHSYQGNCSSRVNNRGDVIYMDCHKRQLFSVPEKLPATLEVLLLSGNFIENTTHKFKKLNALIRLDLSSNRIRRLERGSFDDLVKLEVLILSFNYGLLIDTLPNDVFSSVPHVLTLDLSGIGIDSRYPDEALSRLLELQELRIDGKEGVFFGPNFLNLTHLTSLNMSCWRNELVRLKRDTLRNLKYLRNLEIIECDLVEIERMAFADLPMLDRLDLSNNPMGFDVFQNGSFSLPLTNIKELILVNIKPTFSGKYDIMEHHFKHLSNTSLEFVNLELNGLVNVLGLRMLPGTLKRITLRHNNMLPANINDPYFDHRSVNLEWIDFSHQRDLMGMATASSEKRHEYLTFGHCPHYFFPPKLVTVVGRHMNLQGMPLKCMLFENDGPIISTWKTLEYIDISASDVCPWTGPIRGLDSIKFVNMSHNRCGDVSGEFFTNSGTIETLDLSGNNLQNSLMASPDIFANLVNLRLIILSGNGLKILPKKLFTNISKLKDIILTNNSLASVDIMFHPSAIIADLNLADNQLSEIPEQLRETLDGMAQSTKYGVNVSLHGNNLKCTCDTIEFASWLKTTKVHLVDHDRYMCTHANGTLIYVTRLNINLLRLYCVFEDLVWGALVLILLLVLFVAVPVAMHHNRWKIRYLYYSRGNDINPFELEDSSTDTNSEDAPLIGSGVYYYISFDDQVPEIRDLVHKTVMSGLSSSGISSQTQESYIRPGRSKMICITRGINMTKKTVVFCSKEYFKDFHNLYEFNCSILKGIRTRRRTLIIVNITDMAFNNTTVPDESVLAYLKSHISSMYQYHNGNTENLIDYLKKQAR